LIVDTHFEGLACQVFKGRDAETVVCLFHLHHFRLDVEVLHFGLLKLLLLGGLVVVFKAELG